MIDTQKIREGNHFTLPSCLMADNVVVKEVCKRGGLIKKLCDEVDRLQEYIDECTAWGTGPEKLRAAREKIDQLRKEQRTFLPYHENLMKQRMETKRVEEENKRLREELQQLRKTSQPPGRAGQVIDEQEREIAELKAELRKQEREIIGLKAELQRRHCSTNFTARQKLTEALKDVLEKLYVGYAFAVSRDLNDVLAKYGTT